VRIAHNRLDEPAGDTIGNRDTIPGTAINARGKAAVSGNLAPIVIPDFTQFSSETALPHSD